MAAAETQPRRVPPEQALPEPAIGASSAIGWGAGGVALGTSVGAISGAAITKPGLPLLKAGQESVEAILEALARFFVLQRARNDAWLLRAGRTRLRAGVFSEQDILALIAEESTRQGNFERKVLERVRRDAMRAQTLPVEKREPAVRALLRREQTYARQRSEAMAIRAIASLDRTVLRVDSPAGVGWDLGKAHEHTVGCQILAGHVFPWPALDRSGVFPPAFHAGCRCLLRVRRKGERVLKVGAALALIERARKAEEAHGH